MNWTDGSVKVCSNCGEPYTRRQSPLRHGRCPRCAYHFEKYDAERPLVQMPRTRKEIHRGHLVYGKSCPKCEKFISLRATHCASCANVERYRRERA